MTTAAAPPPTEPKNTLEELRAAVLARGKRKGLRGAIQEAILAFLECFLALLADLRAGRLAPLAPVAEDPGQRTAAAAAAAWRAPSGAIRTMRTGLPERRAGATDKTPPPRPSPAQSGRGGERRGGCEGGPARVLGAAPPPRPSPAQGRRGGERRGECEAARVPSRILGGAGRALGPRIAPPSARGRQLHPGYRCRAGPPIKKNAFR
jgi:hypothetical protein